MERTTTTRELSSRQVGWALLAILGLAAAARLVQVGYNFDGDELFSVLLSSRSFAEVIRLALIDTVHPPLHLILLHGWIAAFGPSAYAVRGLSILLSLAFLATAYPVLRRFLRPATSLAILALLAVSPLFVYYGQQARPYALIALLSAANLLTFLRFADAPQDARRAAAWCATGVLLLYAQYLGALLIMAEVGFGLLTWPRYKPRLVVLGGLSGLCLLPWVAAAMGGALTSDADPLTVFSWTTPPTLRDFPWFYVSIFGEPAHARARVLLLLLGAMGAFWVVRQFRGGTRRPDYLLLAGIAFGIPAVVWALSVWGPKPAFASRQLLAPAVAFLVLVGVMLEALPRRWGLLCWLALLAWTAAALPEAFPSKEKPPWRDIGARVDAERGTLPVVTPETWVQNPLEFYTTGAVLLRTQATSADTVPVLLVCRPIKCADDATGFAAFDTVPVTSWSWGARGVTTAYTTVKLYRATPRRIP